MNLKIKNYRGFTLIELLIVIAIIGLLSSIVLAALSSVRLKARDARRFSDVDQVRNGLQLYQIHFGGYPDPSAWTIGNTLSCNGTDILKIPVDPGTGLGFSYQYKIPATATSFTSTACGGTVTLWSGYEFQFTTEAISKLGNPGNYCLTELLDISSGSCP